MPRFQICFWSLSVLTVCRLYFSTFITSPAPTEHEKSKWETDLCEDQGTVHGLQPLLISQSFLTIVWTVGIRTCLAKFSQLHNTCVRILEKKFTGVGRGRWKLLIMMKSFCTQNYWCVEEKNCRFTYFLHSNATENTTCF